MELTCASDKDRIVKAFFDKINIRCGGDGGPLLECNRRSNTLTVLLYELPDSYIFGRLCHYSQPDFNLKDDVIKEAKWG